jgi:RNA polymerase sigma-70 factor, ECF subfamily
VDREREMIKCAQAGDSRAFCELAQSFQRRIYSLALYYCRNQHDAEDLSQEVWLKAFQAIKTFRGESSFYTWLRQITINTFLNHQRAESAMTKNHPFVEVEELVLAKGIGSCRANGNMNLEEQFNNNLFIEKVMRAVGELTADQRIIFLFKHQEGMTYEEIAQAMGCSIGTIKKSLFRAITKLRKHLDINDQTRDYAPSAAVRATK